MFADVNSFQVTAAVFNKSTGAVSAGCVAGPSWRVYTRGSRGGNHYRHGRCPICGDGKGRPGIRQCNRHPDNQRNAALMHVDQRAIHLHNRRGVAAVGGYIFSGPSVLEVTTLAPPGIPTRRRPRLSMIIFPALYSLGRRPGRDGPAGSTLAVPPCQWKRWIGIRRR